jgi:hypothetical protein
VAVATPGENNPYKKELDDMMHDLVILENIVDQTRQLRLCYEGFSADTLNGVMKSLQLMIRQKIDIDQCIITLSVPGRGNGRGSSRVQYTLEAASPGLKHDWLLELQNVKLALEPRNHPAWFVAESDSSSFKLPLFVEPLMVDAGRDLSAKTKAKKKSKDTARTELDIAATRITLPSADLPNGIGIQHLWVCDGAGHVSIVSLHTNQVCIIESFCVPNAAVTVVESVPGCAALSAAGEKFAFCDETVWMATSDDKIIICRVVEEDRMCKRQSFKVDGKVSCMKYLDGRVYIGAKNGNVYIYSRDKDGVWKVKSHDKLTLGGSTVSCLLPIRGDMWAACESSIHIMTVTAAASSGKHSSINKTTHDLCKDTGGHIECMVKAGAGLLVSVKDRAVVRLFHLETFEPLQDISVASVVNIMLDGQDMTSDSSCPIHITCLLSESGLLWIGTSGGFILTMPLPRLEGVPQFKGRPTVSYHAHSGAVKFLSAVRCCTMPVAVEAKPVAADAGKDPETEQQSSIGVGIPPADTSSVVLRKKLSASSPDIFGSACMESSADFEAAAAGDDGSVTNLYDSLLKHVDADFDSELTGNAVRHHHHGLNSANIQRNLNVVSSRMRNRLSNVITKSRQSMHRNSGVLSKTKVPMSPVTTVTDDADDDNDVVNNDDASDGDLVAVDQDQSSSHVLSADAQNANQSRLSNISMKDAAERHEQSSAFVRGAFASTSYRRLTVPACPSMVTSNLVHVQSSKALIIVSGGDGYVSWKDAKRTELPPDDTYLLLWKC